MRRRRWSSVFYRAARASRDAEAVASGDPARVARRIRNRLLGRMLRPVFRQLWK